MRSIFRVGGDCRSIPPPAIRKSELRASPQGGGEDVPQFLIVCKNHSVGISRPNPAAFANS